MEYYWYTSLSCSTPLTVLHCSALHCTALPLSLAKIQQKSEGGETNCYSAMGKIKLKWGETNTLRINYLLFHYIHINIELQKDSPPQGNKV